MSVDTKLWILIVLWIFDKAIMFAMIHWEMRKKR